MLQTKKLRLTHVNHLPQELLTAVSDWAEAWKASVSNSRLLCLTSFTQPPPSHLHRLPPVHTMELKTLRTFKIWSPSASIISSPTNALLESPTAGILSPFYLFIIESFLFIYLWVLISESSLVAQMVRHLPKMQQTRVWSLGQEDPLEKEMATHSSTLAWKILWMEKPGRLQSMWWQRVGHDWATSLSLSHVWACS